MYNWLNSIAKQNVRDKAAVCSVGNAENKNPVRRKIINPHKVSPEYSEIDIGKKPEYFLDPKPAIITAKIETK